MRFRSPVVAIGLVVACSLLLMSAARADIITLNRGQQLIVTFTVTPDPTKAHLGTIDTFDLNLGGLGWYGSSVDIYDGSTLLGTYTNPISGGNLLALFTSPQSIFTFGDAASLSDFSSIADGSIQGTLAVSIVEATAWVEYPNFTEWNHVGHAIYDNGSYNQGSINVTSISIGTPPSPVPEPSSFLLLGSGLTGLAGFVRKQLWK